MDRLLYGIHEFFYTLLAFPRAWRFMRNHRLWEGLSSYGWVAKFLIFVALGGSLWLFTEVVDWFSSHSTEPLTAMAIGSDSLLFNLVGDIYEELVDGSLNWVILVLLEVVIYHFMRRTLEIILDKGVEDAHTFKPFLRAQKRMIVVSFIGLGMQEAFLGISGGVLPGTLALIASPLIQSLFLGYAIADNYNEQFELTIKQSINQLQRHHIGICLGLGLPLFLMLKVPLLGAAIGPLVTSVTAAIVLREKSDLHIVGYQMSEKEQLKADKKAEKKRKKEARKEARRKRKQGIA